MAAPLPRLRADLDIMPSPLPEQPGLIVRDPFRFSEVTLLIPPLLARCLGCFDGEQDEAELRATIARLSGKVAVSDVARRLVTSLHDAGFLDDDRFAELRGAREREFAALGERASAHAGSGYPSEGAALTDTLRKYFNGSTKGKAKPKAKAKPGSGLLGIAAPHVSPEGGSASYAAAYRALPKPNGDDDRIFVVLGTSHYGEPDRFGLTRKPFATPFGIAPTETALVDELCRAAGAGRDAGGLLPRGGAFDRVPGGVPAVPLRSARPHSPRVVRRVFGGRGGRAAAGEPARASPVSSARWARSPPGSSRRLCFVLGVDFAHVGRRYGDRRAARAYEGPLATVAERDDARVDQIVAGDAQGFWNLVMERGDDDLKWCGSSPIYTFLRAVPQARGHRLGYEQWNIDDASVVSFGALAFFDEK